MRKVFAHKSFLLLLRLVPCIGLDGFFFVLVRFSTILFKYDVVLVVPDLKAKQ